jgi:hypothetical protein
MARTHRRNTRLDPLAEDGSARSADGPGVEGIGVDDMSVRVSGWPS